MRNQVKKITPSEYFSILMGHSSILVFSQSLDVRLSSFSSLPDVFYQFPLFHQLERVNWDYAFRNKKPI
jgi:hypothetical protein